MKLLRCEDRLFLSHNICSIKGFVHKDLSIKIEIITIESYDPYIYHIEKYKTDSLDNNTEILQKKLNDIIDEILLKMLSNYDVKLINIGEGIINEFDELQKKDECADTIHNHMKQIKNIVESNKLNKELIIEDFEYLIN